MRLVERLVDEAIAQSELEDTGLWEYRTHAAALHVLAGDVLGGRASRRASSPTSSARRIAPREWGAWADS